MLKVRSVYSQENGKWSPLLVFITDKALYVADVEHGKTTYNLICFLTHDLLDVIVVCKHFILNYVFIHQSLLLIF